MHIVQKLCPFKLLVRGAAVALRYGVAAYCRALLRVGSVMGDGCAMGA